MLCNWLRERPRRVCYCVGFGYVVCLMWWTARCSPSARDEPQSLHGLNQGRGELGHVQRVCCASHLRPALSCAARSSKYTWKRRVGEGQQRVRWQTLPHLTSTGAHARLSLLLVLGAVSPCVQRWAARGHPPPALGEHPRWSWRVLTLLWGGGRGACTGRAD